MHLLEHHLHKKYKLSNILYNQLKHNSWQCCKTRPTRPTNRRLSDTRQPTFPIFVNWSNNSVNHGQRRLMTVNSSQA